MWGIPWYFLFIESCCFFLTLVESDLELDYDNTPTCNLTCPTAPVRTSVHHWSFPKPPSSDFPQLCLHKLPSHSCLLPAPSPTRGLQILPETTQGEVNWEGGDPRPQHEGNTVSICFFSSLIQSSRHVLGVCPLQVKFEVKKEEGCGWY